MIVGEEANYRGHKCYCNWHLGPPDIVFGGFVCVKTIQQNISENGCDCETYRHFYKLLHFQRITWPIMLYMLEISYRVRLNHCVNKPNLNSKCNCTRRVNTYNNLTIGNIVSMQMLILIFNSTNIKILLREFVVHTRTLTNVYFKSRYFSNIIFKPNFQIMNT